MADFFAVSLDLRLLISSSLVSSFFFCNRSFLGDLLAVLVRWGLPQFLASARWHLWPGWIGSSLHSCRSWHSSDLVSARWAHNRLAAQFLSFCARRLLLCTVLGLDDLSETRCMART
jgi:hypothetical protein